MKRVYLSTPHWGQEPYRSMMITTARRALEFLVEQGFSVFCYDAFLFPKCTRHEELGHRLIWLDACDIMFVLQADTWESSDVIRQERGHAKTKNIPVYHLTEDHTIITEPNCPTRVVDEKWFATNSPIWKCGLEEK